MGRSNKLVDGCYSFWLGAMFPILQAHAAAQPPPESSCSAPAGLRPRSHSAPEALLQSARTTQEEALVCPAACAAVQSEIACPCRLVD